MTNDEEVQCAINFLKDELEYELQESAVNCSDKLEGCFDPSDDLYDLTDEYAVCLARVFKEALRNLRNKLREEIITDGFDTLFRLKRKSEADDNVAADIAKILCWKAIDAAFLWKENGKTNSDRFAEWLRDCGLDPNSTGTGVRMITRECNKPGLKLADRLNTDFQIQFTRRLDKLCEKAPRLRLDEAEKEVQRDLQEELWVKKTTTETRVSEQMERGPVMTAGSELPRQQGNAFVCTGDMWRIAFAEKSGTMRDSMGVRLLARLLQSPGQSFHAKELYGLVEGTLPDEGTELELADPVMDKTATSKLKREFEGLKLARERATAAGDMDELQRIEEEIAILAEKVRPISHSKALHDSDTERARKNVSNQVARTIRKLASIPDLRPLSDHLTKSIATGTYLCYDGHLEWAVAMPPAKKLRRYTFLSNCYSSVSNCYSSISSSSLQEINSQ